MKGTAKAAPKIETYDPDTSWDPSANSSLGVFALTGSGTTLGVGGDFTRTGGRSQQGFAEFVE
jgi:hypothetical protein